MAGRKYALRRRNARGVAEAEVVGIGEPPLDDGDDRALLVPLLAGGEAVDPANATWRPPGRGTRVPRRAARRGPRLQRGEPAIPTLFED